MKKTLAAVAVLGAFAGSALAADVTLYGRVNLGVNYCIPMMVLTRRALSLLTPVTLLPLASV